MKICRRGPKSAHGAKAHMPALIGLIVGIIASTWPILHFVGEGLASSMSHSNVSKAELCTHRAERIASYAPTDMLLLTLAILFLLGGLYFQRRTTPPVARNNTSFILIGLTRFISIVFSVMWGLVSIAGLSFLGMQYGFVHNCI